MYKSRRKICVCNNCEEELKIKDADRKELEMIENGWIFEGRNHFCCIVCKIEYNKSKK